VTLEKTTPICSCSQHFQRQKTTNEKSLKTVKKYRWKGQQMGRGKLAGEKICLFKFVLWSRCVRLRFF